MKVICKYGAGDFGADPFEHILIATEADCIDKGYRELNERWMRVWQYQTSKFPYPDGGHLVRPAVWITVSFPDAGVYNEIVWVSHVSKSFDRTGVWMTLAFERYERSESGVSNALGGPSGDYMITESGEYIELD